MDHSLMGRNAVQTSSLSFYASQLSLYANQHFILTETSSITNHHFHFIDFLSSSTYREPPPIQSHYHMRKLYNYCCGSAQVDMTVFLAGAHHVQPANQEHAHERKGMRMKSNQKPGRHHHHHRFTYCNPYNEYP